MGIDPNYPLVWRFRREHVGQRGVIANLASHLIDLVRFLAGEIVEVAGCASTHIKTRPLPAEEAGRPAPGTEGPVTVFDEACFLARLANGASAVFEASWVAAGHKHGQRIEINGTEGSLSFAFERMNELHVYFRRDPAATGGFRRILVTEPDHPYMATWWPRGHGIAYEHLFIHLVYEFMDALDRDLAPSPDFHDGLMVNRVMDAVDASIAQRTWVTV
jgi:predicted dehydrogenase